MWMIGMIVGLILGLIVMVPLSRNHITRIIGIIIGAICFFLCFVSMDVSSIHISIKFIEDFLIGTFGVASLIMMFFAAGFAFFEICFLIGFVIDELGFDTSSKPAPTFMGELVGLIMSLFR